MICCGGHQPISGPEIWLGGSEELNRNTSKLLEVSNGFHTSFYNPVCRLMLCLLWRLILNGPLHRVCFVVETNLSAAAGHVN